MERRFGRGEPPLPLLTFGAKTLKHCPVPEYCVSGSFGNIPVRIMVVLKRHVSHRAAAGAVKVIVEICPDFIAIGTGDTDMCDLACVREIIKIAVYRPAADLTVSTPDLYKYLIPRSDDPYVCGQRQESICAGVCLCAASLSLPELSM